MELVITYDIIANIRLNGMIRQMEGKKERYGAEGCLEFQADVEALSHAIPFHCLNLSNTSLRICHTLSRQPYGRKAYIFMTDIVLSRCTL
jgi:hypothetical protein